MVIGQYVKALGDIGTVVRLSRRGLEEREFFVTIKFHDGEVMEYSSVFVKPLSPLEELGCCAD